MIKFNSFFISTSPLRGVVYFHHRTVHSHTHPTRYPRYASFLFSFFFYVRCQCYGLMMILVKSEAEWLVNDWFLRNWGTFFGYLLTFQIIKNTTIFVTLMIFQLGPKVQQLVQTALYKKSSTLVILLLEFLSRTPSAQVQTPHSIQTSAFACKP